MLVAEEAVEIRVLRRQGKAFARLCGCSAYRATRYVVICAAKNCRATSVKRGRASKSRRAGLEAATDF